MSRRKKRDTPFDVSLALNNGTYLQYYNRMVELAISMYEWEGLPDSVDPRFLELTLFTEGCSVFFKDLVLGHLALKCSLAGGYNVYGIPVRRRAYAINGYSEDLTDRDSVIIYNNMIHSNSLQDVVMFAKRLYNIDRTIDTNVNAQKTPIIVKCDETQRLVINNLLQQYDGNRPFIWGDKALNTNAVQVLDIGAPYLADKLMLLKQDLWNEFLTYLGIPNVTLQKRERLISDEVQRGQGGTIASRNSRLKARREACEKINKMFGLNISCKLSEGLDTSLTGSQTQEGADE